MPLIPTPILAALGGECCNRSRERILCISNLLKHLSQCNPTFAFDLLHVFAGYFFTYYNTRITEERKAQIERVNEQVQHHPAPLSALMLDKMSSYDRF